MFFTDFSSYREMLKRTTVGAARATKDRRDDLCVVRLKVLRPNEYADDTEVVPPLLVLCVFCALCGYSFSSLAFHSNLS